MCKHNILIKLIETAHTKSKHVYFDKELQNINFIRFIIR